MNGDDLKTVMADAMRHHQAGDFREAEKLYNRVLKLHPGHTAALNNLGALYLDRGQPAKAVTVLAIVLKTRSDYPTARNNMGLALRALGRLEEAIHHYRQALSVQPDSVGVLGNLGSALQAAGNYEEAEESYNRALRLAPDYPSVLANFAELMEWQGRYDEGVRLLEEAGVADPATDPAMLLAYARLQRRLDKPGMVIKRLEDVLEQSNLPASRRQQVHFTLGDLYDDLADYQLAFSHYEHGNRIKGWSFDAKAYSNYVESIMTAFDRAAMRSLPRSESASEQPVFIVGMPRSGTSLIEQILSQHPEVYASGERSDIGVFASKLTAHPEISQAYPAGINQIADEILSEFSIKYLWQVFDEAQSATRITDKMPLNFQHLGFIELIFPRARVVHCTRDPLDIAVSCYFQDFVDPALAFSSSLDGIAAYYHEYARLMDHWCKNSGLKLHELNYERLVESPESSIADLLKFLDLSQENSCLAFYESGRVTRTASHAQVRRPVYRSAVGRHKNYAQFLGPLFAGLRPQCGADER